MTNGLRVNDISPVGERPGDRYRGRVGYIAGVDSLVGIEMVGTLADGQVWRYDAGSNTLIPADVSGPLTVEDEGVDTGDDASVLNFVGAGVTATGSGGTKTITIPGATAGAAVLPTDGGEETVKAHGTTGSTETIDLADGNYHTATLDANCTISFATITAGVLCRWWVELLEDGTGGHTPSWPAAVVWVNGVTPTHDTTIGSRTVYEFWSIDGGTTIFGSAGGGSRITYAAPTGGLGTSNSEGVLDTVLRSDAVFAAFDGLDPTTQAFADTASPGASGFAADRLHRHGMPASGTGIGEILISDTPSTPLIFADLLQNDAQTDLIYADP